MSRNRGLYQLRAILKQLVVHGKRLPKRDAPTPENLPEAISEFSKVIQRSVGMASGIAWGYLIAKSVQPGLKLRVYVVAAIAASVMGGFCMKGRFAIDAALVEPFEEAFRGWEAPLYRVCVDAETWVRQDLQELTFIVTSAPSLLIIPGLDYPKFMASVAGMTRRHSNTTLLGTTLLPVLFKWVIPLDVGPREIETVIRSISDK